MKPGPLLSNLMVLNCKALLSQCFGLQTGPFRLYLTKQWEIQSSKSIDLEEKEPILHTEVCMGILMFLWWALLGTVEDMRVVPLLLGGCGPHWITH